MRACISLVGVLCLVLPLGPAIAARETVDRVAAIIEDEVITMRELEQKAEPFLEQLRTVEDPEVKKKRRDEIYRQVLDIEIGERIVERELKENRDKLGVTEQDVDRAIEEVLRLNNLDRERLQAALYGQGMTWAEYRKKLREQIERARLIQFRVQGKVQVKESEVKRRCEERRAQGGGDVQICASHILLRIGQQATAKETQELYARASQLQAELRAGADFAAYALKFSDDKNAPDGKLGCFSRGELEQAFEDAAFKLKEGEVSGVVRTRFGFHIIKLTDRRAAPTASCDESALNAFRNELYQEEMQRQMNAWIEELKQKAFVEVRI